MPAVFAGQPSEVKVIFHNPGTEQVEMEIVTRLFQTSSATLMPVGEAQSWKRLRVLPQQTILESARLTFPVIKAPTVFQVQWGGLGKTDVIAYPPDLLKGLKRLAGDQPLGVFDPDDQLRTVFKKLGVEYQDLETEPGDCRLAIVWSTAKRLSEVIQARLKKGAGVVWVHPTKTPAAYALRQDAGLVVTVSPSAVAGLAAAPASQFNLLRFAEMAVQLSETNQP